MQSVKILDEQGLRLILGLINKIASIDESINNIQLADNKVFSNLYTKLLIDQVKEECRDYTDIACGALTKLTAEKIDFEPTLDNTTDKLNTILLYSIDGGTNYSQFLRLQDELVDLGETTIDIDGMLSKEEASNTYTTKLETEAIVNSIGDMTTLETNEKTSIVNAINEIKEELDEKEVVKEITWVEYQALSEEEKNNGTLYNIPNMPTNLETGGLVHIANYTDNESEGLDFNNFLDEGIYTFGITNPILNSPAEATMTYGSLKVIKYDNANGYTFIEQVYDYLPTGIFHVYGRRYVVNKNKWSEWRRLSGTTIPDVPNTQLALTLPSTLTVGTHGIRFQYMVVDGVCEMFIYAHLVANTFTGYSTISTGMPMPMLGDAGTDILPTDSRNPYLKCAVTNSGDLRILIPEHFNSEGAYWTGTLRYKVAEDWRP